MVYLPMAYLYGKKFVGPITPTILALREEIYDTPYVKIDWSDARNKCAKVSATLLILQFIIMIYMPFYGGNVCDGDGFLTKFPSTNLQSISDCPYELPPPSESPFPLLYVVLDP
jgi:hypothetical protein